MTDNIWAPLSRLQGSMTMTKPVSKGGSRKKGDPQTPAMNFAARISWLQRRISGFQLSASHGEIMRHAHYKLLVFDDQKRLTEILNKVSYLESRAQELAAEIAEFNRTKKTRKV